MYQNVYATEPGSAEMPSAGRPFTPEVLTRLIARGVGVAPVAPAHRGGLARGRRGALPRVLPGDPGHGAAGQRDPRRPAGKVVAIGTTVVRALETVVDERGVVSPGRGWTETVVTPDRPVRAVDGLLTGWHEPEASHLAMLEAIAGRELLERSLRRRGGRAVPVARVRRRPPGAAVTTELDAAPLANLPTTRRAILTALKRAGPATAAELAGELGITVAAVRQQLHRLADDGLVRHHPDPDGRGRPVHRYELTAAGRGALPQALRRPDRRAARLPRRPGGRRGRPACSSSAAAGGSTGPSARLADRSLEAQVAELTRDPRRGRLPRRRRGARGRRLADHRAQLRHPHRRHRLPAGLLERARVHPVRPAGRPGGAGRPPDGRRARLRLRGPAGLSGPLGAAATT